MQTKIAHAKVTQDELHIILQKLESLEDRLIQLQQTKDASSIAEGLDMVLMMRLSQLTLKRHAVLTATLGGLGYDSISELMQCSDTTVKLHLKAAMGLLDIPNRSALLSLHKDMLDGIPDSAYMQKFGISKRWWMEDMLRTRPNLLAVLTSTKPPANQHRHYQTETV